eukprot:15058799-Alexandrium_andersonii.AAC.1
MQATRRLRMLVRRSQSCQTSLSCLSSQGCPSSQSCPRSPAAQAAQCEGAPSAITNSTLPIVYWLAPTS